MYHPLEGEMKYMTVSRNKSGRYFVSIIVEVEIREPILAGRAVGIDFGLRDFATLSSALRSQSTAETPPPGTAGGRKRLHRTGRPEHPGHASIQRGLDWLSGGKSQLMVSLLQDLFCRWYAPVFKSATSPGVAMSGL
jgi:hypothetical protein